MKLTRMLKGPWPNPKTGTKVKRVRDPSKNTMLGTFC
jgi:hypothetical protein